MVLAHNERKLDTQAIVWAASQLKSSVRAAMCVTRSIITCVFLCVYASQLKSALHWVTIIIQEEVQVARWTETRQSSQSTLPSSAFTTVEHDEDTIAQSNKCSHKTIVQLPDCSTLYKPRHTLCDLFTPVSTPTANPHTAKAIAQEWIALLHIQTMSVVWCCAIAQSYAVHRHKDNECLGWVQRHRQKYNMWVGW